MLDEAAIAERLRWQLDGWLSGTGRGPARPTAGILRLRLVPDGVLEHAGFQLGLWGDAGQQRDRAHRAMTRVQGMLGPDAVLTAVLGGGRDPGDQMRLVPWGDERVPARPGAPGEAVPSGKAGPSGKAVPPWPGRTPAPSPATVPPEPLPATVLDRTGEPVRVNVRLAMTGAPSWLALGRDKPVEITGWAGPWPVEERWWATAAEPASGGARRSATPAEPASGGARRSATPAEPAPGGARRSATPAEPAPGGDRQPAGESERRVRFQVSLADGRAMLLSLSGGCWWVIGVYD